MNSGWSTSQSLFSCRVQTYMYVHTEWVIQHTPLHLHVHKSTTVCLYCSCPSSCGNTEPQCTGTGRPGRKISSLRALEAAGIGGQRIAAHVSWSKGCAADAPEEEVIQYFVRWTEHAAKSDGACIGLAMPVLYFYHANLNILQQCDDVIMLFLLSKASEVL